MFINMIVVEAVSDDHETAVGLRHGPAEFLVVPFQERHSLNIQRLRTAKVVANDVGRSG